MSKRARDLPPSGESPPKKRQKVPSRKSSGRKALSPKASGKPAEVSVLDGPPNEPLVDAYHEDDPDINQAAVLHAKEERDSHEELLRGLQSMKEQHSALRISVSKLEGAMEAHTNGRDSVALDEEREELKALLEQNDLSPSVLRLAQDRLSVLENLPEERRKLIKDQEGLSLLQMKIDETKKEIEALDICPDAEALDDPKTVREFLVRKLKKINALRPKRLTTAPRRLSKNFMGMTVERKEQLFKALHYCHFPERYSESDRLGLLLMLGCPGSGKTHMMDEIPRITLDILKWKKKVIKTENNKLKNLKDSDSIRRFNENNSYLPDIAVMEENFNTLFFVPFSLNSHVSPQDTEDVSNPRSMVVSRFLFCYFCQRLSFQSFREAFKELIDNVSIITAFDAIRYDQSIKHDDDPKGTCKPFDSSRGVLIVDEVSKILPKDRLDVKAKEEAIEKFYNLIKAELFGVSRADRIEQDSERGGASSSADSTDRTFPVACVFTCLEFSTFRTFEPGSFDSRTGSTRRLEWLMLTPAAPPAAVEIKKHFQSENIPMETIFVQYMIAATSGHWRSLERMITYVKRCHSSFCDEYQSLADLFNLLVDAFTQLTLKDLVPAEIPSFFGDYPSSCQDFSTCDVEFADHALYFILRHTILQIPYVAKEPHRYLLIDRFILSGLIANGTQSINFKEIPVFSIPSLIKYAYHRTKLVKGKQPNPFLVRLLELLKRAAVLSEKEKNRFFEGLVAEFEWMRQVMICHPTLTSFLSTHFGEPDLPPRTQLSSSFSSSSSSTLSLSSSTSPSPSPKLSPKAISLKEDILFDSESYSKSSIKKLTDLYPEFTTRVGSPDVLLQISAGRMLRESKTWFDNDGNIFQSGDVFLPTESNNPGFDLMVMTQRIISTKDEKGATVETLKDFLILIECKYSAPVYKYGFGLKDVEKKYKTLLEKYEVDPGFFTMGKLKMKWKNVAYIVITAYKSFATPKQKTTFEFLKFPGIILTSDQSQTGKMLGSPLNNCGALLQSLDKKSVKDSSNPSVPSTSSSSSSTGLMSD